MTDNTEAIISISLNQQKHSMLFRLQAECVDDVCKNIFDIGYNLYFPDIEHKNEIKTNLYTESIKEDINRLRNDLDISNLDSKIDKFTSIIQDLFGINANSSRRGRIAEDFIYTLVTSKFKDYSIDISRNIPHSGDYIITIPSENKQHIKIMLEVKNYTRPVGQDELDKLLYDMQCMGIHYSIFISLKSSFVGKKRLQINDYDINNGKYNLWFFNRR